VQLNPAQPQALVQSQNPDPAAAQNTPTLGAPTPQQALQASVLRIFNPAVGRYEVQADVGPAFATKRAEAFAAFLQVISTAPQIMNIAGDLMFKSADFPLAEELAERLQRMVPPQAMGTGPPPEVAQLNMQLQGAQAHIALLSEQLAVERMKHTGKDAQADVDAYRAVTDRMGTLLSMKGTDSPFNSGEEVRALVINMVRDALRQNMAMQLPGPPPPQHPAGGIAVPAGLASGQMTALSPVRPPFSPTVVPGGQR
jgi:hypothetical protein